MLTFDQYGHLTPYEVIPTDVETTKAVFVEAFGGSTTRTELWASYTAFVEELRTLFGHGFYQWLDGSFTTFNLDWKIYQQHVL